MLEQLYRYAQARYKKVGAQKLDANELRLAKKLREDIDNTAAPTVLMAMAASLDQLRADYIFDPDSKVRLMTAIASLVVAAKAD